MTSPITKDTAIVTFPWTQRWLNGKEYKHMLSNYLEYSSQFGFSIARDHPTCIYTSPSHGLIYFLEQTSLKDLGFPRVKGLRKRFKWKKMNFITPLPKQKPCVHYLVATGRLGFSCYRMHIVALSNKAPILCHMLKIQTHLAAEGIPSRQHYKENSIPSSVSLTHKFIEEYEPESPPVTRPERKMHPIDEIAYEYILAPFRKSNLPLRELSILNVINN
jgi:hypothetical protein